MAAGVMPELGTARASAVQVLIAHFMTYIGADVRCVLYQEIEDSTTESDSSEDFDPSKDYSAAGNDDLDSKPDSLSPSRTRRARRGAGAGSGTVAADSDGSESSRTRTGSGKGGPTVNAVYSAPRPTPGTTSTANSTLKKPARLGATPSPHQPQMAARVVRRKKLDPRSFVPFLSSARALALRSIDLSWCSVGDYGLIAIALACPQVLAAALA
jgi:hypothetical protein